MTMTVQKKNRLQMRKDRVREILKENGIKAKSKYDARFFLFQVDECNVYIEVSNKYIRIQHNSIEYRELGFLEGILDFEAYAPKMIDDIREEIRINGKPKQQKMY